MVPSRHRILVVAALAVAACSSHAGTLGEVGTYTDGGDGTPGFASGGDAGAGVHVSIASTGQAICGGQCVDLSAIVIGGVSPYAYAWSGGGLRSSTASLHACPTATTTYTVTAADSSGTTGELAKLTGKGSATTTITVGSTCAGAPDGGAGPPARFARERCSVRWPLITGPTSPLTVIPNQAVSAAADAAGNLLLAVTFNGTLTADGKTFTSQGTSDTLVAKLDPMCHVVWMKDFGGVGAGIMTTNIASDASLDVIVGGFFNGNIDFGFGAPPGGGMLLPRDFVIALTATGAPRWAGPAYAGVVDDLASGPKGDVALATNGPQTGFDAGANGGFDGIVKLSSTGQQGVAVDEIALGTFSGTGALLSIDMNATGTVVLVGPDDSTGSATSIATAAEMAPDGTPLWSVHLPTGTAPAQFMPPSNLSFVSAAVDAAGDAFVLASWQSPSSDTSNGAFIDFGTVTRISAAGQPLWAANTTNDIHPATAFSVGSTLALDAMDNVFVGGILTGSATFGAVGSVTSAGPTDIAFAVYDPSGVLRSAATWGAAGVGSSLGSLVTDGSDVVLAGTTSTATETDVFVARVGW